MIYYNENKGEWVVGLNPDDRMPNDWLRMVARVFASYRKKPLKESIVAYIDGLNLSVDGPINNAATVNITPGQAFVDDQFIGFLEDSNFQIDTTWLVEDERYCVVLYYRWINQTPPNDPQFMLVKPENVNTQEMLCLGYLVCHRDPNTNVCSIEVIDEKKPWYEEMVATATGNTEVDESHLLPYIVSIKSGAGPTLPGQEEPSGGGEYPDDPAHPELEQGSLDIGWAIDFHHYVGNHVNYNTRLHTDQNTDGVLFINGHKIISELDGNNPSNPDDPSDPGDTYIEIGNNMTFVDSYNANLPIDNLGSDSGKVCISLKTENTPLNGTMEVKGASICFDHTTGSLGLQNKSDFNAPGSAINTFELTDQTDLVTINGKTIWHEGNLDTTGLNIMFLGYYPGPPTERQDGSPLQEGDTYYDTSTHAYYFYQVDHWEQVGQADSVRKIEFTAIEGQQQFHWEYNPNFLWVGVSGVNISSEEYVASDGQYIWFNKPLRKDEVVTMFTIMSASAYGLKMSQITDVAIGNLNSGDALIWNQSANAGAGVWENSPVGVDSLNDINDVQVPFPNDGDFLKWSQASGEWIASGLVATKLTDLADTSINTPQARQCLTYDGQYWVNEFITPPGTVIMWPTDIAPDGFLECNGSAISRVAYQELFNTIGTMYGPGDGATTFNIPDLRGIFVRGWDHGANIDTGRIIGTNQQDEFKSHTHKIVYTNNNSWFGHGGFPLFGSATTADTGATGGSETRPKNIALMYCIKY
jgi:microcystin-dependent protein